MHLKSTWSPFVAVRQISASGVVGTHFEEEGQTLYHGFRSSFSSSICVFSIQLRVFYRNKSVSSILNLSARLNSTRKLPFEHMIFMLGSAIFERTFVSWLALSVYSCTLASLTIPFSMFPFLMFPWLILSLINGNLSAAVLTMTSQSRHWIGSGEFQRN